MNKTVLSLLIVLSVFLFSMPHSQANKKEDQPYELNETFLDVNDVLSQEQLDQFEKEMRIINVTANSAADTRLFDSSTRFKHLRHAVLMSKNNRIHLANLAKHYTQLKQLTIYDDTKLSNDDVQQIERLKRLEYLDFRAEVQDPGKFVDVLNPRLETLIIAKVGLAHITSRRPRKFSSLTNLTIHSDTITADFMSLLQTPILTSLDLTRNQIEPGALLELSKFRNLRKLYLSKGRFPLQDIKTLQRALPKLSYFVSRV